jgi:2-oxoglutarate ferredoxin oxidoreductase subunit alpha
MAWLSDPQQPITLAVSGAGGSGALTAGYILLAAAQGQGLYGLMMRSAGPQVRGGESVAILRLSARPVHNIGDRVDLLAALDWRNIERFFDELPLTTESLVLHDSEAGPIPERIAASAARQRPVEFARQAAAHPGGRANMIAVGLLGGELGLPPQALSEAAERVLGKKSSAIVESAQRCIQSAYCSQADQVATAAPASIQPMQQTPQAQPAQAMEPTQTTPQAQPNQPQPPIELATAPRWRLSGNAAAGLGALRAGVGFVAAYPITPASEMLEWLAPRLESVGGVLLQAEDELAAVNMLVGASFGGVAALTATSGPGLSLMTEGIGLAIASETPIIVVNVARGGPSTGLPTKSEQADLNQALYGLHGDAPHLVIAPLDVGDCTFSVEWASRLAERLQTAAIVLSDQALGQTHAVIDAPARCPAVPERKRIDASANNSATNSASNSASNSVTTSATHAQGATPVDESCEIQVNFTRYALTPDGISPMPRPGEPGLQYTADGLAHNTQGTPSSSATDHRSQLTKLAHKLDAYSYGDAWARIDRSDAETASPSASPKPVPETMPRLSLITWGSSWGAVQEAAERLRAQGQPVQTIGLRLIAPLQRDALRATIGDSKVLVVEVNAGAQLFRYLNAERALPQDACSYARPGPLPLRPSEIIAALQQQAKPPQDSRGRLGSQGSQGSQCSQGQLGDQGHYDASPGGQFGQSPAAVDQRLETVHQGGRC